MVDRELIIIWIGANKGTCVGMRLTILSLLLILILPLTSLSFAQSGDSSVPSSIPSSIPAVIHLTTEEYIPFTSRKLKHFGVFSHIVSEAFRLEGVEVEYAFHPASRSFKLAQTGEVDGTIPWAYRTEREADFLYSDPILNVGGEYFFHRRDFQFDWDATIKDYRTLNSARFGAIFSYDYGKAFQDAEASGVINVTRVSSLERLLKMLLNHRIDIAMSKDWVARYALLLEFSADEHAKLTSRPETAEPPSYDYLLFSKLRPNAQLLLETFNAGLKKLHASGRYDIMLKDFEKGEYLRP